MTEEEKLLWMFEQVHGEMTGACYAEVNYSYVDGPVSVSCMKDGQVCWTTNKADLVFDFLTKHL